MRVTHTVVASRLMVVTILSMSVMFYFVLSHILDNNKQSNKITHAEVVSDVAGYSLSLYEKDSDGDGIPDWEELLWGTDPYNPDTFGNGLGDWEEIYGNNGAGSVAAIDGLGPVQSENLGAETATELLARRYFSSYMLELQNGFKYLTPEKHDMLVDEALLSTLSFFKKVDYNMNNVQSVLATPAMRTQYVHTVQSLIVEMFTTADIDRNAVAMIASGEYDKAELTLKKNAQLYSTYLERIKQIVVPDDAVRMHVFLVSTLEKYINAVEGLSHFRTDPLLASASFSAYQKQEQYLADVTKSFTLYVTTHNIEPNPSTISYLRNYASQN